MYCVKSNYADVCVWCGEPWGKSPYGFHRKCTNHPNLRPAADKLGLPNPIPPSLTQTVARFVAGQPLGPGDWLHIAILRWVNEGPTRKCGCEDRINQMNAWGPTGCREHLDEIVDWLTDEAKKRGWWKYAVAVPGSKLFIKRMVLGAIKKAEDQSKLSSSVPSQQLPKSSAGT